MVSDTMLTNELTKAPIPITKGLIKTKIITPTLAVSFAVNADVADKRHPDGAARDVSKRSC
jgi:hypothetical protein